MGVESGADLSAGSRMRRYVRKLDRRERENDGRGQMRSLPLQTDLAGWSASVQRGDCAEGLCREGVGEGWKYAGIRARHDEGAVATRHPRGKVVSSLRRISNTCTMNTPVTHMIRSLRAAHCSRPHQCMHGQESTFLAAGIVSSR